MNIDSIQNGVVIDHIKAGKSMEIYNLLQLYNLDCPVALITNAHSGKMGAKDIIKIDSENLDIDLDVIGLIDPNATVNIIRDGQLVEKKALTLPLELRDVLKCKNPRCITSVEQDLSHVFRLTDKQSGTYRCLYCEAKAERRN